MLRIALRDGRLLVVVVENKALEEVDPFMYQRSILKREGQRYTCRYKSKNRTNRYSI